MSEKLWDFFAVFGIIVIGFVSVCVGCMFCEWISSINRSIEWIRKNGGKVK